MIENELVSYLLEKGVIRDRNLLEALLKLKRKDFLPPDLCYLAELDVVVPTLLRDGHLVSTSSQPSLIMEMLQELELAGNENVLDIGTGTGFSTALLGMLLKDGSAISLEYDSELCDISKSNLAKYAIDNVSVINTDGFYGYPPGAPYDRIISMVACGEIPVEWILQLEPDGLLIMPFFVLEGYTPVVKLVKKDAETLSGGIIIPASFITMEGHKKNILRNTLCRGSRITVHVRKKGWNDYFTEYEVDSGMS